MGPRFVGDYEYTQYTRNPVVKDTIIVPSAGCAVVRIFTDNPGYWFFHCHFEWHLHTGMALIFKAGETNDMVPPPKDFPQCANYLPPVEDSC